MSTLKEIREEFITRSGRFDLVVDTTDYVDNGANFLIQAGQRWLDLNQNHRRGNARYKEDLSAGTHIVNVQNMRSLKEVWIANADGRTELDKKSLAWLRSEYADDLVSEVDQDTPLYYALTVSRLAPQQLALTSSDYTAEFTYDVDDIMFADEGIALLYDSVIIMPPPDEIITIELIGQFFSVLSTDTDKSFWSELFPELSVLATMLAETIFFRNSEGMRDMKIALLEFTNGIDKDGVESDIANFNQIGG